MSFRLQSDGVNPVPFSHAPFHLSVNDPTMTSRPKEAAGQIAFLFLKPRNRGVRVVKSLAYASRWVARWPGSSSSRAKWARESLALKPCTTRL
ncbi:hypothetical protein AMTRI_Chr11g99040 [Amborella trichopoda]